MMHGRDGAGSVSRPPTKVKRKRRRTRLGGTRQAVDVVGLIDTLFNKRIPINEGGVQKRISGFGAILQMMWTKEMSGDQQALTARRKYEAFAHKQRPERRRDIIVEGGLPDSMPDPDV